MPEYRQRITRNRRTHFFVDTPDSAIKSPGFTLSRRFQEIGGIGVVQDPNLAIEPGMGWRLRSYIDDLHKLHLASTPSTTKVNSGNASLATGLVERKSFRQQTDKPWIASSSELITSGDEFYTAEYAAGETSPISLGGSPNQADSAAYAQPLDPWLETTAVHEPNKGIVVRFNVPGAGVAPHSRIVGIYFTGPQTIIPGGFTGNGQYCLYLNGDGTAELWEYGQTRGQGSFYWKAVFQFVWSPAQSVSGSFHAIGITSDAYEKTDGNWYGTKIFFRQFSAPGATLASGTIGYLADAIKAGKDAPVVYFTGPRFNFPAPDVDPQPLRIDVRRDIDLRVQARLARYPDEATVVDKPFTLNGITSDDETLTVYWRGHAPSGTDIEAVVKDDSGTPLTGGAVTSVTDEGWYQVFELPSSYSGNLHPEFTLVSDGTDTPILVEVNYFKDPLSQAINVASEKEVGNVQEVIINQATDDPSDASVYVRLKDVTHAGADPLLVRSSMPFRIETEYDEVDPGLRVILASGYVRSATGFRKGIPHRASAPTTEWPHEEWNEYIVNGAGQWARMAELVTVEAFNVGSDPTTLGQPYRVTDIIIWLLREAGYGSGEINIPDIGLRFFPSNQELLIESYSDVYERVRDLAANYLGGYVYWDDSAGLRGQWRFFDYPKAPYIPLAEFLESPAVAGPIDVVEAEAYPDVAGVGDQIVKRTFVRHRSLSITPVAPEGNHIIVYGSVVPASGGSLQANSAGALGYKAEAYNFKSALFFDDQPVAPDPSSPDYLGREVKIVVFNKSLQTPEACQFVCRRIYERAAYGYLRVTFDAPLIFVIDAADPDQVRPRPLRFGDPVTFRGETYIVRRCNIRIDNRLGGDYAQFATYEIESARGEVELVGLEEE